MSLLEFLCDYVCDALPVRISIYRKRNLLVLQEEGEELLEPRLLSPVPSAESYSSQGDKKVLIDLPPL